MPTKPRGPACGARRAMNTHGPSKVVIIGFLVRRRSSARELCRWRWQAGAGADLVLRQGIQASRAGQRPLRRAARIADFQRGAFPFHCLTQGISLSPTATGTVMQDRTTPSSESALDKLAEQIADALALADALGLNLVSAHLSRAAEQLATST